MYDSTKISLPIKKLISFNNSCTNVTELINYETGEIRYAFMVRNLRCFYDQRELKIKGSLWIFNKGNNLCNFEFKDIRPTIEELEDILKVNLSKAQIKYLEIAKNIVVSSDCDYYLAAMGELGRKKRHIESHGIYYKGDSNVFVIYDKRRDIERRVKNLSNVPEELLRQNILRPELRLKGGSLKKINSGKTILTQDLYDLVFFHKCESVLLNQYFKINKIEQFFADKVPATPSSLVKLLTDYSLSDPKIKVSLMAQIITEYRKKNILKKNKERMLSLLSKPYKFSGNYKKSEYIEELDKVFNELEIKSRMSYESLVAKHTSANSLTSFPKTVEVL